MIAEMNGRSAHALAREIRAQVPEWTARTVSIAQGVAVVEATMPDGTKVRIRSEKEWRALSDGRG